MDTHAPSEMFIRDLRDEWIASSFWHTDYEQTHLTNARSTSDFAEILEFYVVQVEAARSAILYSNQKQDTTFYLDERYREGGIVDNWQRLTSDIGIVASRIQMELDQQPRGRKPFMRANRRILASQVVLAMRLMLLARLCTERANYNETAFQQRREPELGDRFYLPNSQTTLEKFREAIDQCDKQLRTWRVHRYLPRGWKAASDADIFDQWSQIFGAADTAEEGWSRFRRIVSREFRYLRYKAILRERWAELPTTLWRPKSTNRILWAISTFCRLPWGLLLFVGSLLVVVVLWLFMMTCGFGFKPRRVLGTLAGTITAFAGAYRADDSVLGACSPSTIRHFGDSLYVSVTTLTSLGTGPTPCGPLTGVIESVEALAGYFLLSALAAMFFIWLTDR